MVMFTIVAYLFSLFTLYARKDLKRRQKRAREAAQLQEQQMITGPQPYMYSSQFPTPTREQMMYEWHKRQAAQQEYERQREIQQRQEMDLRRSYVPGPSDRYRFAPNEECVRETKNSFINVLADQSDNLWPRKFEEPSRIEDPIKVAPQPKRKSCSRDDEPIFTVPGWRRSSEGGWKTRV